MPLLLQFSIALFTGMVAATLVPAVRKALPRVVEVGLWIAFVTVCVFGVASITDVRARELSSSAVWGTDQLLNTLVMQLLGGALAWVSDHRFVIATWLLIVAGADALALNLVRSMRNARSWQPRIRLGEWMEVPVPGAALPAIVPVADPLEDLNRRLASGAAILGSALLTGLLNMAIWARDVFVPASAASVVQAARGGRTQSRARLEAMRDAAEHLGFAARAWYAAAAAPALDRLAVQAAGAMRSVQPAIQPAEVAPGQVIDIQALVGAQSIGWFGPLSPIPPSLEGQGKDGGEPQHPDRLAS